jgi:tetratricopeptide (TPR) repeat protein
MIDEHEKGILSIKAGLKTLETTLGPVNHFSADGLYALGGIYTRSDRGTEALSAIRKANAIKMELDPAEWIDLVLMNHNAIRSMLKQGLIREAIELADENLQRGSNYFEFGDMMYLALLIDLLDSHHSMGNFEEVVRLSEPHMAIVHSSEEPTEIHGKINLLLGRSHSQLGNSGSAIFCFEKSASAFESFYGPENEWTTKAVEALTEARAAANR